MGAVVNARVPELLEPAPKRAAATDGDCRELLRFNTADSYSGPRADCRCPKGGVSAAVLGHAEADRRQLAPGIVLEFCRIAVAPEQIEARRLLARPPRTTDTRTKPWTGGNSVELDAIEANQLRRLCEGWIETLIAEDWLATIQAAEKSERSFLASCADAAAAALQ